MCRNLSLILVLTGALAWTAGCGKDQDQGIANDLKTKMAADTDLKTAGVQAQVKDGQVTLTGNVPTPDVELKAMKIANEEPGVTKVNDEMKVQTAQAGEAPPPADQSAGATPAGNAEQPAPASQPAQTPPPQPAPAPPPPPQPTHVTIPAGTTVAIRMIDPVDSSKNATGQQFRASLAQSIRVHGEKVVPYGTSVVVQLVNAESAGHIKGQSELALQLMKMTFQGQEYGLTSDTYTMQGKSRGKQTAKRVGIGAVAGTVIGAIAGGGKGAAIGAAVGGGGTAAFQGATKGQQISIPSETQINFVLQAPVTVTVAPK